MESLTFKRLKWQADSQRGYTIDQTILVVAVIAILVTLIIGSVGWDLLSRASSTKLSAQLKQIETANGQFFSKYASWPTDANASNGVNALLNKSACGAICASDSAFHDLLPGIDYNGGTPQHDFGAGGKIIEQDASSYNGDNQKYIRIEMDSIPTTEYNEAEKTIDGDDPTQDASAYTAGRLQVNGSTTGSTVTLYYYANVKN